MKHKNIHKKLLLCLMGLCLILAGLEAGLRIAGWIFIRQQQRRNRTTSPSKDEIRILCLGESTTAMGGANSYPRQLERLLQKNDWNRPVRVINKGVPGTTTSRILRNLNNNLIVYKPHIVITMMGINDHSNMRNLVTREDSPRFMRLRILKLAAYLWTRHQDQPKMSSQDKTKEETEILEPAHGMTGPLEAEGDTQQPMPRPKTLSLQEDFQRVFDDALKTTEFLMGNMDPKQRKQKPDTPTPLKDQNPRSILDEKAPHWEQEIAEHFAKKPSQIIAIAAQLRRDGHKTAAMTLLIMTVAPSTPDRNNTERHRWETLAIDGRDSWAWAEILLCLDNTKREELVQRLARAAEGNRDLARTVGMYYLESGNQERSRHFKLLAAQLPGHTDMTSHNYQALCKSVLDKNITLVCVQYPMRSLEELRRRIGAYHDRVVLVDNGTSFRHAVRNEGFDACFVDIFSGDSGHCTPRGDALLASNVANAVVGFLAPESGK